MTFVRSLLLNRIGGQMALLLVLSLLKDKERRRVATTARGYLCCRRSHGATVHRGPGHEAAAEGGERRGRH